MKDKTLNILLIGGLGFIGQALINFLAHQIPESYEQIKIIVLTRSLINKQRIPETADSYYTGNAADALLLERILFEKKIHYIIHLAGVSTVAKASLNPADAYLDNVKMTNAICEACSEYRRIRGVILASTSLVYQGSHNQSQHFENELIDARNLNPYIKSKYLAEFRAFDITDFPIVILRLSNIYGPGDTHKRLIPLTIQRLLSGEQPQIYVDQKTKLSSKTDYLFIYDLTEAVYKIILRLESDRNHIPSSCSILNIGSGCTYYIEDIVRMLIHEIDPARKPVILTQSNIDFHYPEMNVEKAEKEFGFKATTSLSEGLKITVNAWKKNFNHSNERKEVQS